MRTGLIAVRSGLEGGLDIDLVKNAAFDIEALGEWGELDPALWLVPRLVMDRVIAMVGLLTGTSKGCWKSFGLIVARF